PPPGSSPFACTSTTCSAMAGCAGSTSRHAALWRPAQPLPREERSRAADRPLRDRRRMSAPDVLCFGEALVDLLPDQRGRLRDCERFEVHSGGAPANVAVGLARLGVPTAFCGVVGDDEFGQLLARKLRDEGVDTRLRFAAEARTGLWFVALDERGDRTFFSPGGLDSADKTISRQDALAAPIPDARWLHCGSSCHI